MVAVRDVRLPENVERGVQGGPRFKTTFHTLVSGHENRNVDWSRTRGEWDAGYGIQLKSDFKAVIDLFYASFGMAYGFRLKDWSDFELGVDATDSFQSIGAGDAIETDFQAYKRYQSDIWFHDRTLTRIVTGTSRVFLGGVEQGSGWTMDDTTGILSFSVAPGDTIDVGLICEFDVPVRFDMDELNINMATFEAGSIPSIPLVEIKEGP